MILISFCLLYDRTVEWDRNVRERERVRGTRGNIGLQVGLRRKAAAVRTKVCDLTLGGEHLAMFLNVLFIYQDHVFVLTAKELHLHLHREPSDSWTGTYWINVILSTHTKVSYFREVLALSLICKSPWIMKSSNVEEDCIKMMWQSV